MKLKPIILSCCLLMAGCGINPDKIDPGKITSINIIDHNGMSETISSKDRLSSFDKTDFFNPQPYQKVMRIYGREKNGDIRSCITSYHPNGQIKQYLEASNNRAFGKYFEWHACGQLKIEAYILGGISDINNKAEESWIFEGRNRVFDEEGRLVAEILYSKGELDGESLYYHPNGQVWKILHYEKNELSGMQRIFLENGSLFQLSEYKNGKKNGNFLRYWNQEQLAVKETYENNLLLEGTYHNEDGRQIAEIQEGNGFRAIFGKKRLLELQEYKNGLQEGLVKAFDPTGELVRTYFFHQGEKHGEETDYFPASSRPKLLLNWNQGVLTGTIKTWYENGVLESQREISENKKNGLLTAWYRNSALMLIEEYENDKLVKGEYYRVGEKAPISKIEKGKGIATIFNSDGNFSKKIYYSEGMPVE